MVKGCTQAVLYVNHVARFFTYPKRINNSCETSESQQAEYAVEEKKREQKTKKKERSDQGQPI